MYLKALKDAIQGKKFIQDKLRQSLGILVDAPTPGAGNTDDGNTARTFFNNIDIVAEITGTFKTITNQLLDFF